MQAFFRVFPLEKAKHRTSLGKTSDVSMQKFRCLCPECPMFCPFRRAVFGVSSMFFPDFAVFSPVIFRHFPAPFTAFQPQFGRSALSFPLLRCRKSARNLSAGFKVDSSFCQGIMRFPVAKSSCGHCRFCSEGRFVKGAFHGTFHHARLVAVPGSPTRIPCKWRSGSCENQTQFEKNTKILFSFSFFMCTFAVFFQRVISLHPPTLSRMFQPVLFSLHQ